LICHACRRIFTETKGTVFLGLHYPMWMVVLVLTLLAHGCLERAQELIAMAQTGLGQINTAFIERLNDATFRSRMSALARRTRGLARTTQRLETELFWSGAVYNFCTIHSTLQGTPP
jgi:hypothetical protein